MTTIQNMIDKKARKIEGSHELFVVTLRSAEKLLFIMELKAELFEEIVEETVFFKNKQMFIIKEAK